MRFFCVHFGIELIYFINQYLHLKRLAIFFAVDERCSFYLGLEKNVI